MKPFFAAVDWGTSNFRVWLIDRDGQILARKATAQGMSRLSADRYADVLETHLSEMRAPSGLPVVVCGMAGSRTGWIEAPYLETPVPVDRVSSSAVQPHSQHRPVWILSGVCQRDRISPDVMRGEETQVVGAMGLGGHDGLYCLPGTHSKWVHVSDGKIARFHTFMTGEMYDLLSRHSVLASILEKSNDVQNDVEFSNAVGMMLDDSGHLTRDLFAIRAGVLLDPNRYQNPHSRLSGLLIGAEIASAQQTFKGTSSINLVSGGPAGNYYQAALQQAGMQVINFDAETATVRGLMEAAFRLACGQSMEQNA